MSTLKNPQLLFALEAYLRSLVVLGFRLEKTVFPVKGNTSALKVEPEVFINRTRKLTEEERKQLVILGTIKTLFGEDASERLRKILLEQGRESFYEECVLVLEGVRVTNERLSAQVKFCLEFCLGKIKNNVTRKTARQNKVAVKLLVFELTSLDIASTGEVMTTLVSRIAGELASTYVESLQHLAETTSQLAIANLVESLLSARNKHMLVVGLADDREIIEAELKEVRAINSNLRVLDMISGRILTWDSLSSELKDVERELDRVAEILDYKDFDTVRSLQAYRESVLPQLKALQRKSLRAKEEFYSLTCDVASQKRDDLSNSKGRGGSLYNELTSVLMGNLLLSLGITNLQSMGFPESATQVDDLGSQIMRTKDWLSSLVSLEYFTDDANMALVWAQIAQHFVDLGVGDLREILARSATLAARPTDEDLIYYTTAQKSVGLMQSMKEVFKDLVLAGFSALSAKTIAMACFELSLLENDEPINNNVIAMRLAVSTVKNPVTLLYIGCLRHSYKDGVHSILPGLRENEWIKEFLKVVEVVRYYRIPYKVLVAPSDFEIRYTKIYPLDHPYHAIAKSYARELGQSFGVESSLLSDVFTKRGLLELFEYFYEQYLVRVKQAHQDSQTDEWNGWHHQSVQQLLEKEWLSLASKERGVIRSDASIWTYRQIAKGMACGTIFSAMDEGEPLIVFVSGKRSSSEIENRGISAVNGNKVGYFFLPIPRQSSGSIEVFDE